MKKDNNHVSEWQRMVDGKLYNAGSKELFWRHAKGLITCQRLNRTSVWNIPHQKHLLNKLIPSSKGKNIMFFPPFYCEYGININLGTDIFFNYGCTLLDVAPITLEDGVWLGANVTIATPCHPLIADERKYNDYPDGYHDLEYAKPVTIGKNSWIASCATICGGVTIGENCVVAAGAVVLHDVPPNSLVAGVPAKIIRTIDEQDKLDVWKTYCENKTPISPRDIEKERKSQQ